MSNDFDVKNEYSGFEEADPDIVEAFKGWTITKVYMTKDVKRTSHPFSRGTYDSHVEGGLTFDLERAGESRRVILGYTELGEWLEDQRAGGSLGN